MYNVTSKEIDLPFFADFAVNNLLWIAVPPAELPGEFLYMGKCLS